MNKEKELAIKAARELCKAMEAKSDISSTEIVFSMIGDVKGNTETVIAGSPTDILVAFLVIAQDNPEFRKMILKASEIILEAELGVTIGNLGHLVDMKEICPCPKCVARRKAKNPLRPTDVN